MKRRHLLFALALIAAAPPPKPLVVPAPPPTRVNVQIVTSAGTIMLELDRQRAPITTANFLRYAAQKRFDGTAFYRAMKLGDGTEGLIQGGTQNDPKRVLKPIAHEPTNVTGIPHEAGAISMARFAPGTATGDFSLLVSAMPALDASTDGTGDKDGYAAFGKVVSGMEIVKKIHAGPTSPTKGEGFLKGQMLEPVVRILTVREWKPTPMKQPSTP